MKKRGLIKNAIVLTVTSFILRVLGMVIRSYLSRKIGAEGMGLYQLIVSIYVLATTIVTAGISTAVIRMVTESLAKKEPMGVTKKIVHKSIVVSLFISGGVIFLFTFFSKPIATFLLKDERCISAIRVLVWALPFISVSSCFKSYFVAQRKVGINSISQLLEQAIRITSIFLFLELFASQNIENTCLWIMLSDLISEMFSCMHLLWCYRKDMKGKHSETEGSFSMRYFFQIAFPVAVNRYLSSILRTIENILIPNQLMKYTLSKEVALSQFGMLKGMALPLIFFPASFLTAISTLMVPETSEARTLHQKGKISKLVEKTIGFTLISAIFIAGVFFRYAEEVGEIFYPNTEISFYLQSLSLLIPFMYLESAIAGMMQGMNQQKKALQYNLLDSIIRITFIFIILPRYGIKGFIGIMFLSNMITSSLNTYRILKITNTKIKMSSWLIKPILSMLSSMILGEMITSIVIFENGILRTVFQVRFCRCFVCWIFAIIRNCETKRADCFIIETNV